MLRGKDGSLGNFMLNHPGHEPYPGHDSLEFFTSDRYHRDMKILKILASNSSSSEFMAFLTNDKLMMIEGVAKYYIFLDNFWLK